LTILICPLCRRPICRCEIVTDRKLESAPRIICYFILNFRSGSNGLAWQNRLIVVPSPMPSYVPTYYVCKTLLHIYRFYILKCTSYVNKTTCRRRPSDGVRNNTRTYIHHHTIYKTLKPRVLCQRCFLPLFSLSFCLSLSTRQTNDQFTRVEVVVWRQWQLNSTCECVARIHIRHYTKAPVAKTAFCVLSSSRIIIIAVVYIAI